MRDYNTLPDWALLSTKEVAYLTNLSIAAVRYGDLIKPYFARPGYRYLDGSRTSETMYFKVGDVKNFVNTLATREDFK